MTKTKLYIGLDVHKNSQVVGVAQNNRSKPELYGKWGGSNLAAERGLKKLLGKHGVKKEEVSIVYEAGPTGFTLARHLQKKGYECIVVAPSQVPKKSGEVVKTDRLDAKKLARLHRAGELDAIHIPDAGDEAMRDLCRLRTDASQALRHSKQQLSMYLLRHGIGYDLKRPWTPRHMATLRRHVMENPILKLVLEEYIQAIEEGGERVKRIEEEMKERLDDWEKAPYVRALMSFRGCKEVTALTVISELGDLRRFPSPRQLMSYLGLVPSEESSGQRRRQGGITKTGNGHVRWILVESSSHYAREPKVSKDLSLRQQGQSRAVRSISWRAQKRLNYRFKRLSARGLNRNKVVVALAREFCGFLWELHHQVSRELEAKAVS